MNTSSLELKIDTWQKAAEIKRAGQVAHHCRVYAPNPAEGMQYRDKEVELLHFHSPDLPVTYIEKIIDSGYARKDGLYYFERIPIVTNGS